MRKTVTPLRHEEPLPLFVRSVRTSIFLEDRYPLWAKRVRLPIFQKRATPSCGMAMRFGIFQEKTVTPCAWRGIKVENLQKTVTPSCGTRQTIEIFWHRRQISAGGSGGVVNKMWKSRERDGFGGVILVAKSLRIGRLTAKNGENQTGSPRRTDCGCCLRCG